jgi:hypothetical protein
MKKISLVELKTSLKSLSILENVVSVSDLASGAYYIKSSKEVLVYDITCLEEGCIDAYDFFKEYPIASINFLSCTLTHIHVETSLTTVKVQGSAFKSLTIERGNTDRYGNGYGNDIRLSSLVAESVRTGGVLDVGMLQITNCDIAHLEIVLEPVDIGTQLSFRRNRIKKIFLFYIVTGTEPDDRLDGLEISESLAGLFRLSCPNPYVPLKIVRGE